MTSGWRVVVPHWRLGVPTLGLLVALTAGWPLGLQVLVVVLACTVALLVLGTFTGCCAGSLPLVSESPPVPASAELLPLPAPLRSAGSGEAGCPGATARYCARTFLVVGRPEMTYGDIVGALRQHLGMAKGWGEVPPEGACRRVSWFTLDGWAEECVDFGRALSATGAGQVVTVTISAGAESWSNPSRSD